MCGSAVDVYVAGTHQYGDILDQGLPSCLVRPTSRDASQ